MSRSASAAFKSALAERIGRFSKLATITRTDGTVHRLTDAHDEISYGGNTYAAVPGFICSSLTLQLSGSVSSMDISLSISAALPITTESLIAGAYDNAVVRVVFFNRADVTDGDMPIFEGVLGDWDRSDPGRVRFESRGKLDLGRAIIIETYGPTCRNDLFDFRCALDPDDWVETATVDSATGRQLTITVDGGTPEDGWFDGGQFRFLTGDNAGYVGEVRSWDGAGELEMWLTTPYPPAAGDTMEIFPGCDKRIATCIEKFDNAINFQGEPQFTGDDVILYSQPREVTTTEQVSPETTTTTTAPTRTYRLLWRF